MDRRRLTLIVSLVVSIGALGVTAPFGTRLGAQDPEPVRLPRSVTVDGTMTLDRRAHDACFVAVPPVLTAATSLTIDTDMGTVTGTLSNGRGSGEYLVDKSCLGSDKDQLFTATLAFSGPITGTVDATTGAFTATVSLLVDATGSYGWFPGMPEYDDYVTFGGGFVCGPGEPTPTCPFAEMVREQTATMTGQLQPDGSVTASLDWYTGQCLAITPTEVKYTRDGCPTTGTFALTTTSLVPPINSNPEIIGLAAVPATPTNNDVVTLTVDASDPDGDTLTYQWSIDGEVQQLGAAQASWPRPTPGDHTVDVMVADPYGGTDEASTVVRVREAGDDQDGDGVPDDDDLCPTEFGLNADGCPDFAASVGCAPARPMPGDQVGCAVSVAGVHPGEDLQYDWYVGGAAVQSGAGATWGSGPLEKGSLDIQVDVFGEARSATATMVLVVAGGVVDAETAGFSISSVGCNSGITSDEVLACSAAFQRTREDVGTLVVVWRIDGMVASETAAAGAVSGWALDRPAPGDHTVTVLAYDPVTNYAQSGAAPALVRPGRNAAIPPALQALAAGATVLTVGAWLWLEMFNRTRMAAEAPAPEPPARTDIPFWMTDPRSLEEIWAQEAAMQAAVHGLSRDDWEWNAVTGALVHRNMTNALLDQQRQPELRDRWHRLVSVLDQNPNLKELSTFVELNEANVWRGDRIDPDQLERLMRAVDRYGQTIAGYQRVPEYTARQQAWDFAGAASQSTAVRVVAGLGTSGLSELALQPWATHYQMVERTRAGWSEKDVEHEALNETIMYLGTTVISGAAVRGFGGSPGALIRRVIPERWDGAVRNVIAFGSRPAGQAIAQTRLAWQLYRSGVKNAWQVADDATRLAQLRIANPSLAGTVDRLYQATRAGGGSAGNAGAALRSAPTLAFTSQEQKHLWSLTDEAFRLTSAERQAAELLRSAPVAYRNAVRQGLVPVEVNQLVNNTRDLALKHALVRTYRATTDNVRAGLHRVDITGTGARPTSVRASSGWTDFDATAVGANDAQRSFATQWYRQVRQGAPELGIPPLSPRRIDATMFPGVKQGGSNAGFRSEGMLNWVEVDNAFAGRSVAPTRGGNLLMGQQPSAAARIVMAPNDKGVLTLQGPPRLTGVVPGGPKGQAVTADLQRMIEHSHDNRAPASVIDDLRVNGKYPVRGYKVFTVGGGQPTPEGIVVLQGMKANRTWVPSQSELAAAVDAYQQYTGKIAGEL